MIDTTDAINEAPGGAPPASGDAGYTGDAGQTAGDHAESPQPSNTIVTIESPQPDTNDTTPLSLASQLEALLYAAGEPASLGALGSALDATPTEIEAALEELVAQYAVRGIRVQRSGNKVQLVTAPELAARIQKFLGLEEINRLSAAALETLAIIAYSQPITKPQLEMVRGVNCDGVMNTLIARNLIQELGRAESVGHPMRYGVSFEFLQYFGLRGVHELPPVEKLETLPIEKPAELVSVVSAEEVPLLPEVPAEAAPLAEVIPADDDQVVATEAPAEVVSIVSDAADVPAADVPAETITEAPLAEVVAADDDQVAPPSNSLADGELATPNDSSNDLFPDGDTR